MNSPTAILFTALGSGAGAAHAGTLLCAVRRPQRALAFLFVRLLTVGSALALAAMCGQLPRTALAWLVMFCLTLWLLHPGRERS